MAVMNFTTKGVRDLQPTGKRETFFDAKEKGLFFRMYPSGRKTYFLNYAHGGVVKIGDADILTAQQARRKARRERSKIEDGIDPKEARKKKQAGTFADYFKNYYQAHIEQNQRGAKQALVRYRYLSNHKLIGKVQLSAFDPFKIERFQSQRRKDGVKGSTINRDVSAIQAMLEHAVKNGFLAVHPFKGKVSRLREPSEHPRYLLPEEETRLREALKARDDKSREERKRNNARRKKRNYKLKPEIGLYSDHLTPLVLTAMLTACRRAELFNLTWQDIDLQAKTLTVRAEVAKSGKTLTVPLREEALEVLATWQQLTRYSQPGDYVFPNEKGQRFDNIKKSWGNLMEAAKITNFRFHDLRHHCASKMVQNNIDLYVVKEWLGHSDFKTTQRYAHLAPDNLKAAAREMDSKQTREAGKVADIKKELAAS